MKIKQPLLIMILGIAILFSAGCTDTDTSSTEYQEGNAEPVTREEVVEPLVINDHELGKEEYGGYYVSGSATANKDLSYVEIKVKYYDESGALISSDFTNIVDLAAGETWNFKVYGPFDDSARVTEYKIAIGDYTEA